MLNSPSEVKQQTWGKYFYFGIFLITLFCNTNDFFCFGLFMIANVLRLRISAQNILVLRNMKHAAFGSKCSFTTTLFIIPNRMVLSKEKCWKLLFKYSFWMLVKNTDVVSSFLFWSKMTPIIDYIRSLKGFIVEN